MATTICTFINTQSVALVPDLIISKSHVGTFLQGDTEDTYTLTASNTGPLPTTGLVTVSDILPAGLTATAITGTGSTCTPTPLTCTRCDALAAGASYQFKVPAWNTGPSTRRTARRGANAYSRKRQTAHPVRLAVVFVRRAFGRWRKDLELR